MWVTGDPCHQGRFGALDGAVSLVRDLVWYISYLGSLTSSVLPGIDMEMSLRWVVMFLPPSEVTQVYAAPSEMVDWVFLMAVVSQC